MQQDSGSNRYLDRFGTEPKLEFRPELLMITCFLASMPLYPPNAYMLAQCSNVAGLEWGLEFVFPGVVGLSCLCLLPFSLKSISWESLGRRVVRFASFGYAAAWAAILCFVWLGCPFSWLVGVVCALWAVCVLPIVSEWVRLFSMDFRNAVLHGALACLASSLLLGVFSLIPVEWSIVVDVVLAVVNFGFFVVHGYADSEDRSAIFIAEDREGEGMGGIFESARDFLSVVWMPFMGLLVCQFMMGLYELSIDDLHVASECIGGVIASALMLFLCLRRQGRVPLILTMERLVIPLCIAVSMVLGSFPQGSSLFFIGAFSVYTPMILISALALSMAVAAVEAREFPLPFIVSAVLLLVACATILGYVCANALLAASFNSGTVSWAVLMAYFALVIVELAYSTWKHAQLPVAEKVVESGSEPELHAYEQLRSDCMEHMAEEYSLTAREREILEYMSRGYNSSYIATKLFISKSTVRTHIKHVYGKLNVNSQEELLEMVEQVLRQNL